VYHAARRRDLALAIVVVDTAARGVVHMQEEPLSEALLPLLFGCDDLRRRMPV
jgi:hypothetical protein